VKHAGTPAVVVPVAAYMYSRHLSMCEYFIALFFLTIEKTQIKKFPRAKATATSVSWK